MERTTFQFLLALPQTGLNLIRYKGTLFNIIILLSMDPEIMDINEKLSQLRDFKNNRALKKHYINIFSISMETILSSFTLELLT